jgi:hypothetical protein
MVPPTDLIFGLRGVEEWVSPGGCWIETMNTTTEAPPLSPADRCDRCGARALIRAILPGGGDLYFCAHHGREHAARLREVAVEVHDSTGALDDAVEPAGESVGPATES